MHGYAIEDVGDGHGALGVSDDDKLTVDQEFLQHGVKAVVVGLIKCSVDLVEDTQWASLGAEDSEEQGNCGECFVSS